MENVVSTLSEANVDYDEYVVETEFSTVRIFQFKQSGEVDITQVNDEGESIATRLSADDVKNLVAFLSNERH